MGLNSDASFAFAAALVWGYSLSSSAFAKKSEIKWSVSPNNEPIQGLKGTISALSTSPV